MIDIPHFSLDFLILLFYVQTPRRIITDDTWRDASGADERILQLNEIHRQQLAELKLRNERLQEEKISKSRSIRYNLRLLYSYTFYT